MSNRFLPTSSWGVLPLEPSGYKQSVSCRCTGGQHTGRINDENLDVLLFFSFRSQHRRNLPHTGQESQRIQPLGEGEHQVGVYSPLGQRTKQGTHAAGRSIEGTQRRGPPSQGSSGNARQEARLFRTSSGSTLLRTRCHRLWLWLGVIP